MKKVTVMKMANICWIIAKAREFHKKTSISASWFTLKPLTVSITANWKILKEMGLSGLLTYLLRNLYAGREITEPDIEQWTCSRLGKENIKAVHCFSAYLIYMQIISHEMPGWMKHKLESRLLGEIITSDMQMTALLRQKVERI